MPCSNVLVVGLFIVGFTDVIVIEGKSILELRVIQRTISAVWYNIKSIQRVNNDWSSETLKSSFFKIWVALRRAMPNSKWWQHTGFVQCSNSSGRQGSIWLVYWTSVLVEVTGCCVLEEDTLLSQYLSPDKIVIGFQRFVTVTLQNKGITCNGIAYHSRWASNIPWVANRNLNLSAGTIKPPDLSDRLYKDKQSKKTEIDWQFSFQIQCLAGLIKCHFCNSREGPCETDTLQGTRLQTCSRWFNQCSLYRMVFPNGTTAQVVRGCDRDCNRPAMKWTLGRYQKTTHCKLCCDSDLCNTHLTDPCSRSSTSLASNILWLSVLVTLGLCDK